MTSAISSAMDSMSHWKDRVVNPWRYNKIIYTDAELDTFIDKIFSLYCAIDFAERSATIMVGGEWIDDSGLRRRQKMSKCLALHQGFSPLIGKDDCILICCKSHAN